MKTAESMWVLDQHAVHERVLYENSNKIKQSLLMKTTFTYS